MKSMADGKCGGPSAAQAGGLHSPPLPQKMRTRRCSDHDLVRGECARKEKRRSDHCRPAQEVVGAAQLRGEPSSNLPELRETLSLVLDGQPVLIVHVSLPLPKVLAQLVGGCPSCHCRSRRLVPGGQVGDCDGFPHVCGGCVCRPVARLPPVVVHEAGFGLKRGDGPVLVMLMGTSHTARWLALSHRGVPSRAWGWQRGPISGEGQWFAAVASTGSQFGP